MKKTSAQGLHTLFLQSTGVSIDTRTIHPGDIFFALVAERDGHEYVKKALDAGASYCVVSKSVRGLDTEQKSRLIRVNDTMQTLRYLAQYHRQQFTGPVIAIAGSNGKTTTKELVSAVLRKKYNVTATESNNNNSLGVSLTLLQINLNTTQIAVVEIGSNHSGELAPLCEIVQPTHGIVTSIGKEHLEGFGDVQGVIDEESVLYEYLVKSDGTAFIPSNLPVAVKKRAGKNTREISATGKQVKITTIHSVVPVLDFDVEFLLTKEIKTIRFKTYFSGSVNIQNILSACVIGVEFGVPVSSIQKAVCNYKPTNFRADVRTWQGHTLILDCYNANPTSMELTLSDMRLVTGPKVLILGGMREMGEHEFAEHKKLLNLIQTTNPTRVILIGPEFSRLGKVIAKKGWNWYTDSDIARESLSTMKFPKKSLILAKGSYGNSVWKVFGLEYKNHY